MRKNVSYALMGMIFGLGCSAASATPLEGFWQSVDDKTGAKISIVEIRKGLDGQYSGKIVHRYPDSQGKILLKCDKCRAPRTNQPIVGLQITWGFKELANKPNVYIKGKLLDARNGKIYNGRATVSEDGKTLKMHGYIGVAALGRTQTWLRVENKPAA